MSTRRPRRRIAVPAALAALALLAAGELRAQHVEPPPPAAYALEGVTVVGPDGTRRPGLTLVVREGRIEALGTDVEVPADAETLAGDSLMVYPGLVDAEGEPRIAFREADEEEEDGGEEDQTLPWDPERSAQGFLAHRRAAEALDATGEDFEEAREAGIVASAVHPSGAVLPGRGALLLHRLDAGQPRELVLVPELGPVMAFRAAGRVYPSTHFGLVAFLRQAFLDAEHHARLAQAHGRRPGRGPAPTWDPDLEALEAASRGATPVFFRADRVEDVRQALDLAARHGFRPIVVGGEEAWRAAEELARRDVPVLVSVDYPEPTRWKPEEASVDTAAADTAAVETATDTGAAESAVAPDTAGEELEPAVLREKRRIEDAYANAGRLVEAGVRIALTSGGGKADLREGARKAVEYGLPEEAALRALTQAPADILGVPWLTRIEPGAAATFVVVDGPLLEEDSEVRFAFVEGRLARGAEPGAEPEEPPAADLTGTWLVEIEGGMGTFEGTMELEQEGARFDGSVEGQFGTLEVEDGLVSGKDVSFTVVLDMGGQTAELDFTGTVSGDAMSGSGSGPPQMGSFTWEATREGPGVEEGGSR